VIRIRGVKYRTKYRTPVNQLTLAQVSYSVCSVCSGEFAHVTQVTQGG
jgi:hypothetical protein